MFLSGRHGCVSLKLERPRGLPISTPQFPKGIPTQKWAPGQGGSARCHLHTQILNPNPKPYKVPPSSVRTLFAQVLDLFESCRWPFAAFAVPSPGPVADGRGVLWSLKLKEFGV